MDRMITGILKNKQARIIVADTGQLVKQATLIHQASPVAAAALGRTLTAGLMMGSMLKGEQDLVTITIKGDGPIGGITVTADRHGTVKGYVDQPVVDIGLKSNGKLDVSGAIGKGSLTIIYDLGLKKPYSGTIQLVSGEIAQDLTYYYATSEQTPSVVGLGVLVDGRQLIRQSGGFMVQLLPEAEDQTIDKIEANLAGIDSVTALFEQGLSLEQIGERLTAGLGFELQSEKACFFRCNCSYDRVEKALLSVGKSELEAMIKEAKPVEMNCHFCNKNYLFDQTKLEELYQQL